MTKKAKRVDGRGTPPEQMKGEMKRFGGSQSDIFNHVVMAQTLSTMWISHSDVEARDQQFTATLAAMSGFKPQDELEGMLAAQAVATPHGFRTDCW